MFECVFKITLARGTEVHCAPSTCIVHHRPALCIMVHKGDLFFLKYGHPNIFFVYVMSHHLDGAQYDVVSLVVCTLMADIGTGGRRCVNTGAFSCNSAIESGINYISSWS